MRGKTAVWFLTMNCNLTCPYCWERQRQKRGECAPEPFADWKIWADAWNAAKVDILDITGGEPFMQPGFVDMVDVINAKIAITTNLHYDITDFVQRLSPEKVFSITLSWHPSGRMKIDEFAGRCLLLKGRGFSNLTVNFVTYPEQMWMVKNYKHYFETLGFRFHVDPYSQTPYYPFKYTQIEQDFINSVTGTDRVSEPKTDKRPVLCSGGMDHVTVFPDGSAWRCINDKLAGVGCLGNMLQGTFKWNEAETPCADYNTCPGCNKDKVVVVDDLGGMNVQA